MHVDRVHLLYTIPSKKASDVVTAYVDGVNAKFGGSKKILSDNGQNLKINFLKK